MGSSGAMRKPSATTVSGTFAVAITLTIFGVLQWRASTTSISIGLWYEDFPFTLNEEATNRLGGPLTSEDVASIQRSARRELERAFGGLRVAITDDRHAFWRVRVVRTIGRGLGARVFNRSGESYALGPFGGGGSVGFQVAAYGAIHYAPPGVSRQDIVEGIGRGIARAAAHEFGHMILAGRFNHVRDDDDPSYEGASPDRAVQYYGDMRWASSWPLLEQKIGRQDAYD
jgi:hypothetical protein